MYRAPFRGLKDPSDRGGLIRFDRARGMPSVFSGMARLLVLAIIGMGAGGIGVALQAYLYFNQDLPSVKKLREYSPPTVTQVFADNGELLAEYAAERRYVVPFEEIPKSLQDSFVSAEDKAFWEHDGVNFWAIVRALLQNIRRPEGARAGGASTITQQLAKNFFLTAEYSYSRKIKEAILALRIEKSFPDMTKRDRKRRILHLYLNQIFFGSGAYGVEAAARAYFAKSCQDLTLAECALIAGLAKAPSKGSPRKNLDKSLERRGYVLKRMLEDARITEDQYAEASREQPQLAESVSPLTNPLMKHAADFTNHVHKLVEQKYGSEVVQKEGLKIYTTVNLDQSLKAQVAVEDGLRELDKRQGYRGPVKTLNVQGVREFLERKSHEIHEPLKFGDVVEGVITHIDESYLYVRMGRYVSESGKKDYVGRITIDHNPKWWVRKPHIRPEFRTRNFAEGDLPFQVGDLIYVSLQDPNPQRREAYLKKYGRQDAQLKQFKQLKESDLQYFPLELEQAPVVQSALMFRENRTGFVRVLIGGSGFSADNKYNRATQARRQVGSSFKPVIYAAALNRGFTCADIIIDGPLALPIPGTGEVWRPKNFGGGFAGPVTFRNCLVKSRNVPTVKILQQIGIEYAKAYARKLGYNSPLVDNLTMALGSTGVSLEEQVNSYSVFPNRGYLVPNVYITKIVDRNGKVLEEHLPPVLLDDPLQQDRPQIQEASYGRKPTVPETVKPDFPEVGAQLVRRRIDEGTAFIMTTMLQDVIQHGTATNLKKIVGRKDVAGKTGTTNESIDAWFVGFSPDYTCGVWVGFDDELTLGEDETGGKAAAPVWGSFMREVLKGTPEKQFPVPQTVEYRWVDAKTGLAVAARTGVQEVFKTGGASAKLESGLIKGARWDYSGADLDQY
ncbi:MAG: PBP1A family penicillin-binding protein [Thermodesulfobacteriota bacterium]